MNSIVEEHLYRIKTAVLKKHTAATIAKWITENTTHANRPYSFKDHEFQEVILSDQSQDIAVKKPSQVGMSETSARMALALVNVLRPYTTIYTLPTAKFAGKFAKNRIDPIIQGSKTMTANIKRNNDNNEVKQFGDSFLYINGASSSNAPISTPADHLIHDEIDFSDQEIIGQYQSRLTHSSWRRTSKLSTPTIPNFGIDKAFQESRRHFNFCKCSHCNFYFIPDYYAHVKIPGYTGSLDKITGATLLHINYEEARVECPACGQVPSLQKEYREFVCENPTDRYITAGYQITPFDAPNVIQASYLVKQSTKYDRIQDFHNFGLGLSSADSEATLSREDFSRVFVHSYASTISSYVMGVDVGAVYHFAVGLSDAHGNLVVVHTERVNMGMARARYMELKREYRLVCTVMDSQPHAETVMALQTQDQNLYASVYVKTKSLTTHVVVDKEADKDKGRDFVRQVNVNRNRAFDGYMDFVRTNHLTIFESEEKEVVISHHLSMKRVKTYDNDTDEMSYTWQKTDGIDHYHHTFLYLWIASKIRGVTRSSVILPLFSAFRMKASVA